MLTEVKRLRQFEEGNGKLKRLVADLSLNKAMLQDVLSKALGATRKRPLVDEVRQTRNVSTRTVCNALRIKRSLFHDKGKRGG